MRVAFKKKKHFVDLIIGPDVIECLAKDMMCVRITSSEEKEKKKKKREKKNS